MLKIKINEDNNVSVEFRDDTVYVDNKRVEADISLLSEGVLHILSNHKSFVAEIIKHDLEKKTLIIRLGDAIHQLSLANAYEDLMHKIGIQSEQGNTVKELRAPMPGLILELHVDEMDQVSEDDNLVVLEAMKMENVLKAPSDLIIKKILVAPGDNVEKNQRLIEFGELDA